MLLLFFPSPFSLPELVRAKVLRHDVACGHFRPGTFSRLKLISTCVCVNIENKKRRREIESIRREIAEEKLKVQFQKCFLHDRHVGVVDGLLRPVPLFQAEQNAM